MSWLHHVPARERALLVGGVAVVLGVPSLALGAFEVPPRIADAVAVGASLLATGAVWWSWRRHGAPGAQQLAERRAEVESDRERDRSIAVSAWSPPPGRPLDQLAARDPAFSLPVLLAAVRSSCAGLPLQVVAALGGPSATAEVIEAREDAERIRVDLVIRTVTGAVRVHVSCPSGARSPAPDAAPGPWRLDGSEPDGGGRAPAPIVPDHGVSAARRALAMRDALDPHALEALAREISAALDAGDEAARPYLTAEGQADLAFWRAVGLPSDAGPPEWLEVGQDGWFDRVEIALGQRVLSLCRAAGHVEAPWELWRVRRRA